MADAQSFGFLTAAEYAAQTYGRQLTILPLSRELHSLLGPTDAFFCKIGAMLCVGDACVVSFVPTVAASGLGGADRRRAHAKSASRRSSLRVGQNAKMSSEVLMAESTREPK